MIFIGLLLISIIGGDQHEPKDQTDNVQDRKVNIDDPQGGSLVSRYHLSIVGPPPKPLQPNIEINAKEEGINDCMKYLTTL